ncbi:kinase-like domain [Cordyceps militaris]|uniref:Kinase-like domain n=1 Tax=Cordyceps militaris TaxID=73501 RepID=A0A2H4S6U1_CORMI|nr:kinase-like domain [Cordyceps militaris]
MTNNNRIEELKRLSRAAALRAEEENRQADEAKRRADELMDQTRPTNLQEYIDACHHLVFSQLAFETDKSLTSKGTVTDPTNKYCPTSLKPWPDLVEDQRIIYDKLQSALLAIAPSFETRIFLSTLGERFSKHRIANERFLQRFLHSAVDYPVEMILKRLTEVEQVRSMYDMGDGVVFQYHLLASSDNSREVSEAESQSAPRTPHLDPVSDQSRPNQTYMYRSDGGPTAMPNMVYVCENTAPHKLTAAHLRAGLQPMNIHRDVVNRTTIPTDADPNEHFQYDAERLTAAALTHIYHFMIHSGLEYGLLTTGEATVFLKVDWSAPSTLSYHLVEFNSEVAAHPDSFHFRTAVGQLLTFTLLALGRPGARRVHGQDERDMVKADLKTWDQ